MNWRIAKMEDELRHHNEELRADGETDQPIRSMEGTDVRRQRMWLRDMDFASCRRLDKRNLYYALLAKLGGSHPNT